MSPQFSGRWRILLYRCWFLVVYHLSCPTIWTRQLDRQMLIDKHRIEKSLDDSIVADIGKLKLYCKTNDWRSLKGPGLLWPAGQIWRDLSWKVSGSGVTNAWCGAPMSAHEYTQCSAMYGLQCPPHVCRTKIWFWKLIKKYIRVRFQCFLLQT